MDLRQMALELRAEAKALEQQIPRLLKAADALDPPRRKPRKKPVRPPSWDTHEAARLRRDGQSWDGIRTHFRVRLTNSGLAQRLSKSGYRSNGERITEEPEPSTNGERARLELGTAGHTSHPDDPDAEAIRERLVHTTEEPL